MSRVHRKVKASTAAAAVAGIIVWVLNRFVFHGNLPASYAAEIDALVPAILTLVAGWLTPSPKPAATPKPSLSRHEL